MKIKCLNDIFVGVGRFCRKNSSKLLTGATIAGIVTTAVVSTRQGSILEKKRAEAEAL